MAQCCTNKVQPVGHGMLLSFLIEIGTVCPHSMWFTILGALVVNGLIVIILELIKKILIDLEREHMVRKEVINE